MWPHCRGSVTTAVVGATAACMIIALLFISITGIYAGNQTADTAAAAAAMAALRALREPILNAAEAETTKRITAFWDEVNQVVKQRVDDWVDHYRAARRAELEAQTPPLPPAEISQIIAAEVAERRPDKVKAFRKAEVKKRKPAIADALLAGTPLPLDLRVSEFMEREDRGCLLYQVARSSQGMMESAAARFAGANGSALSSVQFRARSRLEVQVKVRFRVKLALYDALLPPERRYLTMTGNAYLNNLVGQAVSFPAGCRKE